MIATIIGTIIIMIFCVRGFFAFIEDIIRAGSKSKDKK